MISSMRMQFQYFAINFQSSRLPFTSAAASLCAVAFSTAAAATIIICVTRNIDQNQITLYLYRIVCELQTNFNEFSASIADVKLL